MGQYYIIVNLDKKEYIHPHKFGDGLKLLEFGCSANGTMTALAILLADGNGRGGGDLFDENGNSPAIVGRWAGDRIVIAGDYADGMKFLEGVSKEELQKIANKFVYEEYRKAENVNLYHYAKEKFKDISEKVIEAMKCDGYIRETLKKVGVLKPDGMIRRR
ncbi:MAG: hypothetical protein DRM99_02340 [Thermoplasmata archaeon]|nr:MAG: hypothetical protein DRM99_02340 [Thermoplasmata archaeon]